MFYFKEKDYVQYQVILMQAATDKKKQRKLPLINVGESLIKIDLMLPEPMKSWRSSNSTLSSPILKNIPSVSKRTSSTTSISRERLIAMCLVIKINVPKMIQNVPKVYGVIVNTLQCNVWYLIVQIRGLYNIPVFFIPIMLIWFWRTLSCWLWRMGF